MKMAFKNEIDKLQSKIDKLHSDCQYWQLMVLAHKYSLQKAIKMCEANRAGHYSKDQSRMSKHIDFLKENWNIGFDKNQAHYDFAKKELKQKIKQLKETKEELHKIAKTLA